MYISRETRARVAIGVAMASVGGGVGYILGRRQMVTTTTEETHIEYETVVECEKCKARSDETDGMINIVVDEGYTVADDPGVPDEIATALQKRREEPAPTPLVMIDLDEEEETFPDEEDLEDRSPDTPYVITKAEWDAQESGLQQLSLSWYAGDKILVDEEVRPIHKPEVVVGHLPFGKASGDSNIVYVRNEALKAEYEVVRLDSSYVTDILGMEAEEEADAQDLKHSNQLMKFRD